MGKPLKTKFKNIKEKNGKQYRDNSKKDSIPKPNGINAIHCFDFYCFIMGKIMESFSISGSFLSKKFLTTFNK